MLPWLVGDPRADVRPVPAVRRALALHQHLRSARPSPAAYAPARSLFFAVHAVPLGPAIYPRSIFVIDALLLILMLGAHAAGAPPLRRAVAPADHGKRVLIFGAGDAGELIVRDMKANRDYGYQPVGFVDDDPARSAGASTACRCSDAREDLPRIIASAPAGRSADRDPERRAGGIRAIVRSARAVQAADQDAAEAARHHRRQGRGRRRSAAWRSRTCWRAPPVGLDPEPVKQLIAGRRVMVTGAGGSIGSELCRQIASCSRRRW